MVLLCLLCACVREEGAGGRGRKRDFEARLWLQVPFSTVTLLVFCQLGGSLLCFDGALALKGNDIVLLVALALGCCSAFLLEVLPSNKRWACCGGVVWWHFICDKFSPWLVCTSWDCCSCSLHVAVLVLFGPSYLGVVLVVHCLAVLDVLCALVLCVYEPRQQLWVIVGLYFLVVTIGGFISALVVLLVFACTLQVSAFVGSTLCILSSAQIKAYTYADLSCRS